MRQDFRVIIPRRPHHAQEVRRVDVIFREKRPVPAAAVHRVRVHLPAQLRPRFRDDARQPRDAVQLRRLRRQLRGGHDARARHPVLHDEEIIPPRRRHQQRRDRRRVLPAGGHIVLHKVEKLPLPAADRFQELLVLVAEPRLKIPVALVILVHAGVEQLHKIRVPDVVFHGRRKWRAPPQRHAEDAAPPKKIPRRLPVPGIAFRSASALPSGLPSRFGRRQAPLWRSQPKAVTKKNSTPGPISGNNDTEKG